MSVMVPFRAILAAVWTTFRDMLPIIVTMGIFEIGVLRRLPPDPAGLLLGFLALVLGLTLILRGLEMSLFPIGEALADAMAQSGRIAWLMAFAFAIGFGSTVADPSLAAVATKAAAALVESPAVPTTGMDQAMLTLQMRYGVAVALGLALVFSVWRILKGWPVISIVLPAYAMVAALSAGADQTLLAVALDAGTASTSAINIPLMLTLGIGLASALRSRNPILDGFGMVAFASLTPMLLFLAAAFLVAGAR